MLRRLEGWGLVERSQDPADARCLRIYLTENGRALEELVVRCWAQTEETALAGLGAGERREFRKLLSRVRKLSRPRNQSRLADLSRQIIWEMMKLTFDDRRLKVLGISGTLREGSTNIGAPTASVEAGATLER